MLQNIKIEGYKSIKQLDLPLNKINILIGANGGGKTNFISFFELVNRIYEQRLGEYSLTKGIENLLYYGSKNTEKILGFLKFNNNGYKFILKPNEEEKFYLEEQNSIYYHWKTKEPNDFQYSAQKESFLKDYTSDLDYDRNHFLKGYFDDIKVYHFHDTSSNSYLRKPCKLEDVASLKSDGRNLPAFLYWIKENYPKTFSRIERTIKYISPFFHEFKLQPSKFNTREIQLEWNNKEFPDHYFNAHQFSDGTLRFIALATLFLQPDDLYDTENNVPKTIIIDEPELGLHPSSLSLLAELIHSASERDFQIILATQSVELLNYFSPKDIITVDYENNQSIFKRIENTENLQKWLQDYSLGELWSKSVLEGQP